MLDKYFHRAILIDYLLAGVITCSAYFLRKINWYAFPTNDHTFSISTDLCTISLTLAGFILTLLTVLITFKSGSSVSKNSSAEEFKVFELFFASDLYNITVNIFKNAVKSLAFTALAGYLLKIILGENRLQFLFFYNIFALVIIALTLWRSLLILSKIMKMQNSDNESE